MHGTKYLYKQLTTGFNAFLLLNFFLHIGPSRRRHSCRFIPCILVSGLLSTRSPPYLPLLLLPPFHCKFSVRTIPSHTCFIKLSFLHFFFNFSFFTESCAATSKSETTFNILSGLGNGHAECDRNDLTQQAEEVRYNLSLESSQFRYIFWKASKWKRWLDMEEPRLPFWLLTMPHRSENGIDRQLRKSLSQALWKQKNVAWEWVVSLTFRKSHHGIEHGFVVDVEGCAAKAIFRVWYFIYLSLFSYIFFLSCFFPTFVCAKCNLGVYQASSVTAG